MQIVKPYARMMPVPGGLGTIEGSDRMTISNYFSPQMGLYLLRHVEWCARISHRSEEAVTQDSWRRLLQSVVIDHGDWSVTEHATVSCDFYVDRGITHELVRHRLFAFTQECVSGDTRLSSSLTIREAFERGCIGRKIKSSDGSVIVNNRIAHIFSKGVQPVLSVVTQSGYRIKATEAHEFQIPSGEFVRLESLRVGDNVLVNGRPCLLKIDDKLLHDDFFLNGLSPAEISERYDAPYSTVTRRLRQIGVFRNSTNDKNPGKYNQHHTADSYAKMRSSVVDGYRNGRFVWNKGLVESDSDSVKRQADSLRANHHNNGCKEENSAWKGGVRKTVRAEARKKKQSVVACEVCMASDRLEVHHIDENPRNNADDNLIKLCYQCHRKVHSAFRIGVKPVADRIVTIIFIGNEEVYDLEMQTHRNYVASGFIVHNSTRFVNYAKKMLPSFVVPSDFIDLLDNTVTQENINRRINFNFWKAAIQACEDSYQALVTSRVAPQIARSVFPNALASRIIITGNLRNWRHFFLMRTSKESHPQMREVTIPLLAEFKEKIPLLYDDIEPEARQVDNLRKGR